MTTSDFKKMFKQLGNKPVIKERYIKNNSPKVRTCGIFLRRCRRCTRTGAHIRSYKLGYCRQCFRELAKSLGFKRYS